LGKEGVIVYWGHMEKPEGRLKDQIEFLVGLATRAPSTHNSQPWKFSILDNTLSVFIDEGVQMPESDSEKRYLHISIGYLLHHLIVVGEYFSMLDSYSIAVEGNKVAEFKFSDFNQEVNEKYLHLVQAIFERQNLRGPFKPESVSTEIIEEIKDLKGSVEYIDNTELSLIEEGGDIEKIAELTAESMRRVYKDSSFRAEMSKWIKPNNSKDKDGIHGYSLNQSMFGSILLPHIIRLLNVGKVLAKLNYKAIASAPLGLIFSSKDDSPKSWIKIGMHASLVTLTLLSKGINASVFVAALEHKDTKESLQNLAKIEGVPQFLLVAGEILVTAPRTPRYSVSEKTI